MSKVESKIPVDGLERIEQAARQWSEVSPAINTKLFQLAGSILLLSQQIEMDFRSMTRAMKVDLGPGEVRILLMLRRNTAKGGIRAVDILNQLLITSGAVAKQLTKLEAKKLIVRNRANGRRGRAVELTLAGKEIADRAIALGDDAFPLLSRACAMIEAEQLDQGGEFVRTLLSNVESLRTTEI